MAHPQNTSAALLIALLTLPLALTACSKEEPEKFVPDTSYLEELPGQPAPEADPEPAPERTDEAESDAESEDESGRELVAEEGSRSTLGRARDMGRETRNKLSGGTEGTAAVTTPDEHYAEVEDLSWDVPEDWYVAIPANNLRIAELLIKHPQGNATVTFTKAGGTVEQNIRRWEGQVLDYAGGPSKARRTTKTIEGCTVTLVEMEGIYLDGPPRGQQVERAGWAVRGAIIERPGADELVFVKWFGPEATLTAESRNWDRLIASMRRE